MSFQCPKGPYAGVSISSKCINFVKCSSAPSPICEFWLSATDVKQPGDPGSYIDIVRQRVPGNAPAKLYLFWWWLERTSTRIKHGHNDGLKLSCGRCEKLAAAPSLAEQDAVRKIPQCRACGITYRWLPPKEIICGSCAKRSESTSERTALEGHTDIVTYLMNRVQIHDDRASENRLHQTKNTGLTAADKVKERLTNLQKANKTDQLSFQVQLWIYPPGGGAPKKAQIPSFRETANCKDSADQVMDTILTKVKLAYDKCPAYSAKKSYPSLFARNKVAFAVQLSGSQSQHIQENELTGTVGHLFEDLKKKKLLSEKDTKARLIGLRVFVYEPGYDDVEMDDVELSSSRRPSGSVSRSKPSSKKFSIHSTLRKRKLSISADVEILDPPPPTSRRRYASSYRRDRMVPALTYDAYTFKRTVCEVDSDGTVRLVAQNTSEKILVARDWQMHIKGGKPMGGYISKGFTKYAFHGRYSTADFALFQSIPLRSSTAENLEDLTAELRLLNIAQYFLTSFYERANIHNVNLPKIKWNVANTFIGTITEELQSGPTDGSADNRSLIFDVFLAAPLLTIDTETEERKFSGNDDFTPNEDPSGRFIDAYVHHTLVDSQNTILLADVQGIIPRDGSIILFDPQAHTEDSSSGHWDQGPDAIHKYMQTHRCNAACRALGLEELTTAVIESPPSTTSPFYLRSILHS